MARERWRAVGTAATMCTVAADEGFWLVAPPAMRTQAATAESAVATAKATRWCFLLLNMPCPFRKGSP